MSKAHGTHTVLVDDDDFEELNKFKWVIQKTNDNYYATRSIRVDNTKRMGIQMHRTVMKLKQGDGLIVDHKNHNGLDNRKENLRIVTASQNNQNRRSRKNSTSKYLGVCWFKRDKKWQAAIKTGGKQIKLGFFISEIDAAKAYNQAALKYFKEYANLNKV